MSYKNSPLYSKFKKRNRSTIALQSATKHIGCEETARNIVEANILHIANQILDNIKLHYFISNSESLEGFTSFKGVVKHIDFPKYNSALSKLNFSEEDIEMLISEPLSFKSILKRELEEQVNFQLDFLEDETNQIINLYR